MNFTGIVQQTLSQSEMFLRRNAPTILVGAGVAGFAATTVLVGRAVLKAQDDIDSLNVKASHVKKKEITEEYTKDIKAKEVGEIYVRGTIAIARHFWVPATVGGVSIACVISAHGMMQKRQAGLLAAYTALDAGFKAYRRRVVEELGSEKELDFYRGVKSRKEDQTIGEDGERCVINEYNEQVPSPYSRFFDDSSPHWTKTPEYNKFFLVSQQNYFNDRLQIQGFVFLNEVLEGLGLERDQIGQVVGWKREKTGNNDGFIDFGIFDIADECNRAFVNGIEHTVLLDFNVDGPIQI